LFVTRHMPYGVLSILLIVAVSIAIITLLKSVIAPAISAGVLPMALGTTSWRYPVAIFCGVTLLSAMILLRKRFALQQTENTPPADSKVDDELESTPHGFSWMIAFAIFVAVMGLAAQLTGLRFILFPPLIVMAYEMLGHPDTCPWAKRPYSFPIACFLTALGGLLAVRSLGAGPAAAAAGMVWGVIILKIFDIHMPPALAVALIPLVLPHPAIRYPLSVGIGTVALTCCFLAWRNISGRLNIFYRQEKKSAKESQCMS
jgi:hypothetical protein